LSAAIDASRKLILDEIGDPPDLTFVRGRGNIGDQLICAGTRALLGGHIYREIDLEELCGADGHTVLLAGGGAFCRPYHELMPRALSVAELRFERVIVLPSSFDPSEDTVREALARSRATVFARERESLRRIISLCDARLAHDCAFFFDFTPHRRPGSGVLNAFRLDREATGRPTPSDNDDISVSADTLEEWLGRIAAHDTIRTDRAHVMIAAAMLGKRVEFAPGYYHKVEEIARYALREYPVRAIAPAAADERPALAVATPARPPNGRVSAIVLTRDRPAYVIRAIESILDNDKSAHVVVLDNNSAPGPAESLAIDCARLGDAVSLHRCDRNLGCAGGRQAALERCDRELVLFLDDDAELAPGALAALLSELDEHPEALAATATVEMPDGRLHHSGGWMYVADGVAEFTLLGNDQPADAQLPPSGPSGWMPGTAALFRRAALDQFPLDVGMSAYYEDNEWSLRVERARPGSFRRSRDARAIHHIDGRGAPGADFASRSRATELLLAHARFYERHGLLLGIALFDLLPELRQADGTRDLAAARLLMELLLAKGSAWIFMEWMNGGLQSLLDASRLTAQLERERAEHHLALSAQAELLQQQGAALRETQERLEQIISGGWWRMRRRLLPALRLYWTAAGRGPHGAPRDRG